MDRWKICVDDNEEPIHVFNNYFSLGLDASIALNFHQARNANPSLFKTRTGNKLAYLLLSAPALVNEKKLYKVLTLQVDGRMVDLPKLEGLAIINLPTYGGGNKFWKAVSPREMVYGYHNLSYGDSELEVVGFHSGIHLGGCVSGAANPLRVAQGKVVVLTLIDEMDCQYDGEPYTQQKCTLTISLHEKVRFLVNNSFNN
ncbi:diacylglycerol kinase epsilon-like [Entamoeba marina]